MAAPAPPPPASSVASPATAAGSAPVARAVLGRVSDTVKAALAQQRPWTEVADRNAFSKPESLTEASTRIRKNIGYFRVNYAVFMVSVVGLCMLWNPSSLIVAGLLALVWAYLFLVRSEPLVISGRTLSEKEKFLGLSILTLLIVFVFTSVGSVLISGIGLGIFLIAVHGAFKTPDDLFLDEPEVAGGFLSFLTAGAPASQQPLSHV
jgi:hypothetical protein